MEKQRTRFSDGFYSRWKSLSHRSRMCFSFILFGWCSAISFIFPFSSEISEGMGTYTGFSFVVLFGFLFVYIDKSKSITRTLISGFLYWLFYFIGALYWLVHPLTIDLNLHWMLIPFALLAVPAYLAVPLLLPVYITKKFCKNIWNAALVFASSTCFIMYLQGHYAPGFPWALPGYVWGDNLNIMQALSIWGIYGQTFFTLLMGSIFGVFAVDVNSAWTAGGAEESSEINFVERLKKIELKKGGLSLVILLVSFSSLSVFGSLRLSKNPTGYTLHKVRCVQGSIPQKNKMDRNLFARNLNLYLNLSRMESERDNWNPDFVIWPEASVPYLFTSKSETLIRMLSDIVPNNGYLLAGAVRKDFVTGDIHNSVIVLDEFGRNILNYDKKHLVPFGEYVPFRRFIPEVFSPIANSIGDFAVGKNSNIINLKGLKIALAICYEAIFPGEFIPNECTDSDNSADVDVIINVTNDAWFGHTAELVQHLNIVRARAIEEGIPLIRATNFGISAVFDAYGRKVKALGTDKIGVMDFYIPKRIEKTFFRKFFMDKIKLKQ